MNNEPMNRESLPKELSLLLLLMNKSKDEMQLSQHVFEAVNWDRFLELSRHHRVYPIIYKRLKELTINAGWIPTQVMECLRREYQKNTFQMLHLSGAMESVCRMLSDNQIRSIFLKGPVIALDLYGDISLRTSCDLDLIIPIEDLDRAEELFLELGYEKDEYIQTVLGDWKWRHHHITFFHPSTRIKLEIHWRLNPGPSREPSFRELWDRKRESTLTGYPVYYLGREDLFLFLISHGARHGWSRLRWLVDIDRILKQHIDWNQLKKLLHKYEYVHIGGQAMILAENLLLTPITEQMKAIMDGNRSRRLAQDAMFYIRQMVNLHTEPIPAYISKYHERHLFSLMSFRLRMLFILSFLYPYPEDAKTLPLPVKLHFLYFPLRPLIWALRKTRKHALPEGGSK